jgi:PAS domain S-box-containing protein
MPPALATRRPARTGPPRTPAAERPAPFGSISSAAIHAASEGVVTIDAQQRIVMINPAALRMFGLQPGDALGSPLSRLIPRASRRSHARQVRTFDAAGLLERPMGERGVVRGVRADGEEFPVAASISRVDVHGAAGDQRYFTALLRDLSRERDLQQRIEELNRRMRAVFDLAPVAIWITEGERIVFANRACAALFGAAGSDALVGRSIHDFVAADAQAALRRAVRQALARDDPAPTVSERIVRVDGQVREVLIALARLPDHGHTAVQMALTDITEREHTNRLLEQSRRELRSLAAHRVDSREEERGRVARELHDELGQRLTALKMELASLQGAVAPGSDGRRVAAMLDMVDDTVASVRRIATELRPLMLDDLGLLAAIDWLARGWERRMGISVGLRLGRSEPRLPEGAAIAVYRMVQEALTNIARHARATAVEITLRQQRGALTLVVQDNGVGFDAAALSREGVHGLMGIRERAYLLGGDFEAGNLPRGGARISVRVPLAPARGRARKEPA